MTMLRVDVRMGRGEFRLESSASFPSGITGLIGPNGAGKSTLLHCIAGLHRPDAGHIDCQGEVLFDAASRRSLPPHRRRIGMVFQDHRLLPHLSVQGNLAFALKCTARKHRRFILTDMVELLGLKSLMPRKPRSLSGGEQQRVAIARTLLTSPRALLLDEPLASIDRASRDEILAVLSRIGRAIDIPVVMVSHQLPDVLRLTDRLVLMDRGRCILQDRYPELIQQPAGLESLRHQGLANVWRLVVAEHRAAQGMTLLRPAAAGTALGRGRGPDAALKAPLTPHLPIGQDTQAVLRPQDVAVALAPVEFISMQNQFAGQVERIIELHGQTFCLVDAGIQIIAEITHQTRRDLELHTGKRVWCLFKTHALELFAAGPPSAETRDSQPCAQRHHPAAALRVPRPLSSPSASTGPQRIS